MTDAQIALALKIDVDLLRERFAHELENGAALARAQNLARLRAQADAGNVAAIKRIDEKLSADDTIRPPAPPILGKKEARELAAGQAGENTLWGDDLQTPAARH